MTLTGRVREKGLLALAFLVFTAGPAAPAPPSAAGEGQEITPAAAQADFDALWRDVADNYAYFDSRLTDWTAVPAVYKAELAKVASRSELITLLERVLDELHDAHAQLTVNTPASPRLVPSGADIWAEFRKGRAIVLEVRGDSDAERAGIRAETEILSLDGVAIGEAIGSRLGRSLKRIDDDVRSWALRAVLAGRHDRERRIRFRIGGVESAALLPAADQISRSGQRLISRNLPENIGYIRLRDSLGDREVVPEFDSALARLESSSGLILDLRETPSGGNSSVARAILGRFVRSERPYQKHLLPSEERETGIRRSWLELVTPRGKSPYTHPVVVLVDHWTGSMGEGLTIGFDAAVEGATIVGTAMAGLLGATERFELPQSHIGVNIPTEKLFCVDGTPREAFRPRVLLAVEDLQQGRDPWIQKGLHVLKEKTAK